MTVGGVLGAPRFRDVEVTVYYKRGMGEKPYGGLYVGTRSGRSVSHAPRDSTDSCNATTYYGRMLHDEDMEFFKELKHPDGESRERYAIWNGNPLPHGKWIGMKFVVYNIDEDQHVKLELYRDLSEGVNGGDWEKIGETIDKGGWVAAHDCEYPSDFILVEGGVVLLKNEVEISDPRYKLFSIREIISE